MHQVTAEIQVCIDERLRCYQACLGEALNHCPKVGGKHVEPEHFKLMVACSETCRTSAHFMLDQTTLPFGADASVTMIKRLPLDLYRSAMFATHGVMAGEVRGLGRARASSNSARHDHAGR